LAARRLRAAAVEPRVLKPEPDDRRLSAIVNERGPGDTDTVLVRLTVQGAAASSSGGCEQIIGRAARDGDGVGHYVSLAGAAL
jgi:hypothetical protein